MTKENKELLLKELSARLPYGVIIHLIETDEDEELYCLNIPQEGLYTRNLEHNNVTTLCPIEDVKPYLRPLSSMTEEDKAELNAITDEFGNNWFEATTPEERWKCCFWNSSNEIDWLNAHHFDYRGLIEKGLALEAPEGMYKF